MQKLLERCRSLFAEYHRETMTYIRRDFPVACGRDNPTDADRCREESQRNRVSAAAVSLFVACETLNNRGRQRGMTVPGRLVEAVSEVKSDEIPSATHLTVIRNLLDLAAAEAEGMSHNQTAESKLVELSETIERLFWQSRGVVSNAHRATLDDPNKWEALAIEATALRDRLAAVMPQWESHRNHFANVASVHYLLMDYVRNAVNVFWLLGTSTDDLEFPQPIRAECLRNAAASLRLQLDELTYHYDEQGLLAERDKLRLSMPKDEAGKPERGDDSQPERGGLYHDAGETPPAEYPGGPLTGSKGDVAQWILGSSDRRSMETPLKAGTFWAREDSRYQVSVWFKTQKRFAEANGMKRADD